MDTHKLMPGVGLESGMLPLPALFGFEGPALALLAITVLVVVVLLIKVAVAIAIRVGIVAAVAFGILYALNVVFDFNPLGLPGTVAVDLATVLG